jgi:hypothetical protein
MDRTTRKAKGLVWTLESETESTRGVLTNRTHTYQLRAEEEQRAVDP